MYYRQALCKTAKPYMHYSWHKQDYLAALQCLQRRPLTSHGGGNLSLHRRAETKTIMAQDMVSFQLIRVSHFPSGPPRRKVFFPCISKAADWDTVTLVKDTLEYSTPTPHTVTNQGLSPGFVLVSKCEKAMQFTSPSTATMCQPLS